MIKPIVKAVCVSLALSAAVQAEGPAVSQMNAKVDAFAGSVNGSHLEGARAALSLPLSNALGLQIDALHGRRGVDAGGEDELKGLGAHLFMRDPESHLVGATLSYTETGDINLQRYGLEGEYYLGDFTLGAAGGHQFGDVDDSGYGQIGAVYYPIDNLALGVVGSKADDEDRWGLTAEYQTAINGLTIYGNAQDGNKSFDTASAGIRYYFGAEKSLKARHREDDPSNGLLEQALQVVVPTPAYEPPESNEETET